MLNSPKIREKTFFRVSPHIFLHDMPRLTVLVSGCSVFLVACWLLLANQEAGRNHAPVQLSHATERRPDAAVKNGKHHVQPAAANRELINSRGAAALPLNSRGIPAPLPKKRQAARGITVDRSNIIEDVTMDDLRAPEGRLWIPAAVSGPIDLKASNPIFNVLVAYCQLDMVSYHKSPWLFAMGTFHQRTSGCLDDKSLVRTFRLSSLKRLLEENPNDFMDPTGFIYHETRCGSTLSANMMAAVPSNIVHSETPPPIAALNLCAGEGKCPDGMREDLVRTVFRLMGPVQDGHTHMFFKFQSSKFVTAVEKAWPSVKWIYLFRDPLEVMASNLKGAWRKVAPNAARNGTLPLYNMGGPCVRGLKGRPKMAGGKQRPPSPQLMVDTCAKQLESLNEVALEQIEGGSLNGLAVEYRQLPEVMTEYIYPEHFGMASTEAGRAEFKSWMEPVTHVYSKGMATPQEPAVSKEYKQGMDLKVKEDGSDETMRAAASTMCYNYLKLVELQRWHKETEGSTMGTCSTR